MAQSTAMPYRARRLQDPEQPDEINSKAEAKPVDKKTRPKLTPIYWQGQNSNKTRYRGKLQAHVRRTSFFPCSRDPSIKSILWGFIVPFRV